MPRPASTSMNDGTPLAVIQQAVFEESTKNPRKSSAVDEPYPSHVPPPEQFAHEEEGFATPPSESFSSPAVAVAMAAEGREKRSPHVDTLEALSWTRWFMRAAIVAFCMFVFLYILPYVKGTSPVFSLGQTLGVSLLVGLVVAYLVGAAGKKMDALN